ncbi:MAG: type II toxin-antitoxin system RelE/ParE family toxin [Acidobacteriota bacterium]
MARKVGWTEAAYQELESARRYIALDSARYGMALVREAKAMADSLADNPFRGRIVPELETATVRELFLKSYRIIYEVTDTRIVVLAFMHGARDLNSFLG